MRELKFRAWDKVLNQFIDYNHPKIGAMLFDNTIVMSTGWNSEKQPTWDWDKVEMDRYEFMQFTGYKNVYEGDILKWTDNEGSEWLSKIIWHDYAWCTWTKEWGPELLCDIVENEDTYEIIGNIHQNGELLK